jgi:hypothetical protein
MMTLMTKGGPRSHAPILTRAQIQLRYRESAARCPCLRLITSTQPTIHTMVFFFRNHPHSLGSAPSTSLARFTILTLAQPANLKGHGNEQNFPRFLHKSLWPIGPLHYISSRSDVGFEFAEIFAFEKRLGESTRLPIDTNIFKPLNNSVLIVNYIPG